MSLCYFGVFIILCVWIFLEIFAGVLLINFIIEQEKSQDKYLTKNQVFWLKIQKILAREKFLNFPPPSQFVRKNIFNILKSKFYYKFIHFIFLLNLIIVFNDINNSSDNSSYIYIAIIIFYNFEFISKMYLYGFNVYISLYWKELFIASSCLIEIVIKNALKNKKEMSVLLKFLAILKLLPILRPLVKVRSFVKCLRILIYILPFIINMLGIFFINLFIFSVLGCFLFRRVENGIIINDLVNFSNLFLQFFNIIKNDNRR